MNADDIPLKILVCDPDRGSAETLHNFLVQQAGVPKVALASKISEAQSALRDGDFNTVFIDVIGLGIRPGSEFVFSVRKALPEVVFVLYVDRSVAESVRHEFYKGERSRFSHYYSLDKRTSVASFAEELRAVLTTCRHDLSWRLSATSLQRLREEAKTLTKTHDPARGQALASEVEEIVARLLAERRPPVGRRSVFLSHRFAERDYVEGLTRLLEDEGFQVVTGKGANTYVSQAILQQIKDAEYFVCLMTHDKAKTDGTYTTSPWLLEEKGAALAFGKRIVLMVEEGVDDIGGLQGDWQRIHFGPKGFLTAALDAVRQLKSYAGGR